MYNVIVPVNDNIIHEDINQGQDQVSFLFYDEEGWLNLVSKKLPGTFGAMDKTNTHLQAGD
jgi:hypothetical protein